MAKISIFRNGVWAGTGRIDSDGQIVDCPAILGDDQDASDETYEAIEDAITNEPQDADRYAGEGSVTRPDGVYSWTIEEEAAKARGRFGRLHVDANYDIIDSETGRWVTQGIQGADAMAQDWVAGAEAWPAGTEDFDGSPVDVAN